MSGENLPNPWSQSWILGIVIPVPIICLGLMCWCLRWYSKRTARMETISYTGRVTQGGAGPRKRQVWYSAYSVAGDLRHVALFVGRNKYEIRQDDESKQIRFATRSYPSAVDDELDAKSFSQNTNEYMDDDLEPGFENVGDEGYKDNELEHDSRKVGYEGPFVLHLGRRQAKLDFYLIGKTARTDQEIIDICQALDKIWVYNILSHNCQHWALVVASVLVERMDRLAVWQLLFGDIPFQLRILNMMKELDLSSPSAQDMIFHAHDSTANPAPSAHVGDGSGGGGLQGGDYGGMLVHLGDGGGGGGHGAH